MALLAHLDLGKILVPIFVYLNFVLGSMRINFNFLLKWYFPHFVITLFFLHATN